MCGHKPSPNIIVQLMFYCFEVFVVPSCVCVNLWWVVLYMLLVICCF